MLATPCLPFADRLAAPLASFDPASSTTFRNESAAASGEAGASVQLALGSLSAQATLGQDDCTARGPAPNDTYIYPNQTLAVAYASNQLYYDGASQGVLGFGSAGARAFADSLVGHRIANGSLPSFSVGFDYGRSTERIAEDAGEVHWGGISRTATDEPLCVGVPSLCFASASPVRSLRLTPTTPARLASTWVEVLNSSTLPDWTVHLDGVTFNGKNLSLGEGSTEQHAELEPCESSRCLHVPHGLRKTWTDARSNPLFSGFNRLSARSSNFFLHCHSALTARGASPLQPSPPTSPTRCSARTVSTSRSSTVSGPSRATPSSTSL